MPTLAEDENLDLDLDPEDHFTTLKTTLEVLADLFEEDETVATLLKEAEAGIEDAVNSVGGKKEEKDEEERDKARREEQEAMLWERQAPARPSAVMPPLSFASSHGVRSIFSDVDE